MQPRESNRRGFTLIEVIAAMSVLAIIMLLISQAYTSVNSSWRNGMVSSDQNSSGRAALAFMARELSQAVVNSNFHMRVDMDGGHGDASYGPYGSDDSTIWFATLSGQPQESRTSRQVQDICYRTATDGGTANDTSDFVHRKIRRIGNYKLDKLSSKPSGQTIDRAISTSGSDMNVGGDLLIFVRRFEVMLYCFNKQTGRVETDPMDTYKSWETPHLVPHYADLYLEVLGQDVAQTAAQSGLSSSERAKYCAMNSQRFTTRVYFPNISATLGSTP